MEVPGPLLASGRDSEIFELGPNLVLRRSRDGRSMDHEARIMEYLHRHGYPVPAVEGTRNGGSDLIMERVDGPTMVDALARAPWLVRHYGHVLADLHHALHAMPAPDFLRAAPVGQGNSLLHLDLHPLNVIMSGKGPVVIDWTGASRGDPAVDVGLAWVLMVVGEIPENRLQARLMGAGRTLLVNSFIARFDRKDVTRPLREVVAWKARDPNMTAGEVRAMWAMVERAEAGR